MSKRLTLTALWMLSHPQDTPCPKSPVAAAAWRKKRFLTPRAEAERQKYEEMLATDAGEDGR